MAEGEGFDERGADSQVDEDVIATGDSSMEMEQEEGPDIEEFKRRNQNILSGRNLANDLEMLKQENMTHFNYDNVLLKYDGIMAGLSSNIRTRLEDIKEIGEEIEKRLRNPSMQTYDMTHEISYPLYKEKSRTIKFYQDIIAYLGFSIDFMQVRERKLVDMLKTLREANVQQITAKVQQDNTKFVIESMKDQNKTMMDNMLKLMEAKGKMDSDFEEQKKKLEIEKMKRDVIELVKQSLGGRQIPSYEIEERVSAPVERQEEPPAPRAPAAKPAVSKPPEPNAAIMTRPAMDQELEISKNEVSPINYEVLNALSKKGKVLGQWMEAIALIDKGAAKNKEELGKKGVGYAGTVISALKRKGILEESWGEG